MARGMVLYWKNGNLVFQRRLTDPYRTTDSQQTKKYAEDITGNGDYIYSTDWAQFVYDPTLKVLGAYFKVTGMLIFSQH